MFLPKLKEKKEFIDIMYLKTILKSYKQNKQRMIRDEGAY